MPKPDTDAVGPVPAAVEGAGSGSAGDGKSVPVVTVVLFVVGVVVMVLAAANITNLSEWAVRWGQIPVFLVFFLVMAIGGRWFWAGIDAMIAAVRGREG